MGIVLWAKEKSMIYGFSASIIFLFAIAQRDPHIYIPCALKKFLTGVYVFSPHYLRQMKYGQGEFTNYGFGFEAFLCVLFIF